MKAPIFAVLIIAAATTSLAATADLPHVSVLGTAVTEAKPDLLRWSLTVSDKGPELAAVSETHAAHTAAVLRLLSSRSIRAEETQTSGMRFSENREYRGNNWVKEGYVATTQVAFTMRNQNDYRDMWLDLARLSDVSVDSVTWDVSNRIDVQNKTRSDALRSAKAKAEQMAAALGGKIAEPLAIEEVPVEEPWVGRAMMSNAVQGAPQQEGGDMIAPGSVSVRIRVQVVFRLVTS